MKQHHHQHHHDDGTNITYSTSTSASAGQRFIWTTQKGDMLSWPRNSCIRRHISHQLAESLDAEVLVIPKPIPKKPWSDFLYRSKFCRLATVQLERPCWQLRCWGCGKRLTFPFVGGCASFLINLLCKDTRLSSWWLLLNLCKAVWGSPSPPFSGNDPNFEQSCWTITHTWNKSGKHEFHFFFCPGFYCKMLAHGPVAGLASWLCACAFDPCLSSVPTSIKNGIRLYLNILTAWKPDVETSWPQLGPSNVWWIGAALPSFCGMMKWQMLQTSWETSQKRCDFWWCLHYFYYAVLRLGLTQSILGPSWAKTAPGLFGNAPGGGPCTSSLDAWIRSDASSHQAMAAEIMAWLWFNDVAFTAKTALGSVQEVLLLRIQSWN